MPSLPPSGDENYPTPNSLTGRFSDLAAIEREKIRERRRRVLAHPDIAQRLTEPPLNMPTPEMWAGYIPPAEVPSVNGYKPNMSPRRRALVEIVRAVRQRENELALQEGGAS